MDGLDEEDDENDEAVPVSSTSCLKLKGKREEDLQETEAEESESEESESQDMDSQGSWQKLNNRTIVSGNSLQENLRKSVSCRFCHSIGDRFAGRFLNMSRIVYVRIALTLSINR